MLAYQRVFFCLGKHVFFGGRKMKERYMACTNLKWQFHYYMYDYLK